MWRTHKKMVPKKYFDYSRYNLYKKCPLSFLWTYEEKRIPKTPNNLYYTLNGSAIQKLFELFYNEQWYLKEINVVSSCIKRLQRYMNLF